jgi:tRNA (cytidine32/uridine32-2'-O)-methyltransferase
MTGTQTAPPHARRIVVVLNRTQDVVNIATALRAMANMGLERLRLVAPDDFSAYRIAGIAHGTESIIERIEFFDDLPAALADAVHVVGTTGQRRTASYNWQHPREAAPELLALPATEERPLAVVFGREDTGLVNAELDLCDRVLVIPAHARFPSLNLSQALLLISYELWLASGESASALPEPKRRAGPAGFEEQQRAFIDLDAALKTIEFYKTRNPESVMRSMRKILRRADLNQRETALLRAFFIEIRRFIERHMKTRGPAESRGDREGGA